MLWAKDKAMFDGMEEPTEPLRMNIVYNRLFGPQYFFVDPEKNTELRYLQFMVKKRREASLIELAGGTVEKKKRKRKRASPGTKKRKKRAPSWNSKVMSHSLSCVYF